MTASGNLLPFDARERLRRTDPRAPPRRDGAGIGLRLAGIARHFGENGVLSGVELDVAPGEFVAIVGHSGCGKSTLLRLIAGLDKPSGGALLADGEPVAGQLADARILFQDARLLPWRRVLQNVGIGARGGWKPAALEVLRRVGLEDRAGEWPAVLSGGQRQRVALARALLARPKLLLLDEPLGALDALTRLEMQQLVEEVWLEQGFTAILVTHDVGEAIALADRVVVLGEGKISMVEAIERDRPRLRGDAALAEIEGRILDRLMRRR
jgi:sulfonate transport system ATP-binding protein